MNKPFCEHIDRESLVEEYVRGNLQGEILTQFEQHLRECARHTREVQLEKSLRSGVIEFARNQVRSTIRKDPRPQEDRRYAILRYAAFLFVAVVVPLMLYYQFRIFQPDLKPAAVLPGQKASADSVQERSTPAAEKSTESLRESATVSKVAARARKTESPPPAGEGMSAKEQPALTMEEQQDAAVGQIAAGSKRQDQQLAAEVPQTVPEVAASETELLQNLSTKGHATKLEHTPIPGDLKEADSSRSEIVRLGYGVSAGGGKSSIDDQNINSQITAQQADLLNCTAGPDSTGFIIVKFQITGRGVVEDVQVMDTNIRDINIKECIIEKIRKWKFTAPGQETIITKKIYLKY